jgi:hypothetical protein
MKEHTSADATTGGSLLDTVLCLGICVDARLGGLLLIFGCSYGWHVEDGRLYRLPSIECGLRQTKQPKEKFLPFFKIAVSFASKMRERREFGFRTPFANPGYITELSKADGLQTRYSSHSILLCDLYLAYHSHLKARLLTFIALHYTSL